MGSTVVVRLRGRGCVDEARQHLQSLGLWTTVLHDADGDDRASLLVGSYSQVVDACVLKDVPGVEDVLVSHTSHPKVDASAHKSVRVGSFEIGTLKAPIVIAGPCSVESLDQIEAAASMAAASGAKFLRGGAYKPRTSPYGFQGHGREALGWLRKAADTHDMAVVTEVMSECDAGCVAEVADLLQVGSRNMHNYALLKVVGSIGKPVLLKRGMAATVKEWLLGAEYLLDSGAPGVVFCERGIRSFDGSTRNVLDLGAVALLKSVYGLVVVVDPSHATGRRDLIVPMCRAALAAGADGVMVEVHPNPACAQSDGAQAVGKREVGAIGRMLSSEHGCLSFGPTPAKM